MRNILESKFLGAKFFAFLLCSLVFLSLQVIMAQESSDLSSLMEDFTITQSEEQLPKFYGWRGLGLMVIGIYLVGLSISIFLVHRNRLSGVLAPEMIVCLYLFWMILMPYTIWCVFRKKRMLIYRE